jgi:hypothetical protein
MTTSPSVSYAPEGTCALLSRAKMRGRGICLRRGGTPLRPLDSIGLYTRGRQDLTEAWQRKEGKNPSGGLNAKGRRSYNRATGGNLKPPQPGGGARKKSFCARMKGMKRKLTGSAKARDPKSRINKSLRAWRC